jgi:hypothetical protein
MRRYGSRKNNYVNSLAETNQLSLGTLEIFLTMESLTSFQLLQKMQQLPMMVKRMMLITTI